jgi:LPXTG-motif cell wall-anchored protein
VIDGKEDSMVAVQVVAGVLAVAVLGIIVYRRKQKAA